LTTMIRRARASDARRLTAVAHAAKRTWGYPERWIGLWQDDLTVPRSFVRTHPVFCAVRGRRVVAFYGLSRSGDEFELEHLWVDPDHMGTGVGRRLFRHALATVRARRGRTLRIAADPHAEGFYAGLGARRVGVVPSRPAGRTLPLLEVRMAASPPRTRDESPAVRRAVLSDSARAGEALRGAPRTRRRRGSAPASEAPRRARIAASRS
jgi:GNAT superfamily N-acetyltransferase